MTFHHLQAAPVLLYGSAMAVPSLNQFRRLRALLNPLRVRWLSLAVVLLGLGLGLLWGLGR